MKNYIQGSIFFLIIMLIGWYIGTTYLNTLQNYILCVICYGIALFGALYIIDKEIFKIN